MSTNLTDPGDYRITVAAQAARRVMSYTTMVESLNDDLTNTPATEWARMGEVVGQIAGYCGQRDVWTVFARLLDHLAPMTTARDILTEMALLSDDTWSGRNNDARRSYADGVRKAVRDAIETINEIEQDEAGQ
jgi:hypothetical protein